MKVVCLTPILNVSNIQESFAWFEKLGWKKLWDWGDPPGFGAVRNGEAEIFSARTDRDRAAARCRGIRETMIRAAFG